MGHGYECDCCGQTFKGKPSASLVEGKLRDAAVKLHSGESIDEIKEYCPVCLKTHYKVDELKGNLVGFVRTPQA